MEDDQEQGFYYQIPGGLLDKDVIEIHGRFLGDSDISVRLLAEDLSPELTRTLPFGFLLTSHGKWSVEVIDDKNKKHEQSGNVTLPEVQIFKIRIIAYSANYELYVNDTKLLTQPHMVPLTAVSHLAIDGEAEFTSVEFKDLNSEAESAQSEDTTSSRSSNSAMESRDKLPEITAQPGFVRLSESRRSYNRRPDDPVLIPLNSSIRRREADLQPYERYDEQAVRTTQVESSYAVPTLPSQSENATGGQVEASKAAKVRTVPAPAAKDKEKRRSSSRLLDKLHRRKSTDHVGHKGSHDQRMEASPSVWHAEGGVEMSVDSKEIYKGGKQSAVSEPNLTTATKAGKEAKHKSSKHSIFSKHSKDPKDSKKRSASSPPNVPALGVKSSKNESDKKKGHSSLMGSKLGSHKSKTSKTDKRKSVPTAASTEGTSNAHLARTQENNNEYAVTGGEEISAATTLRTSRTSTASTKNKHSMHFKPSQKGAYDLKSAKDRGSLDETGGLKGVASLPKTDNDTNMHHFPRSNLDELNSPIVNQQLSDDTFVYAALPPADLDHLNSRTRSSHSSRSPDSKRGHKDILPASELGALGKRSSESSRNSSWSPHRGEQAKGAQLPYHSAQRASDNDRESWSPSSRSASESPNRTNKQDGAIGNLQPLMVTSTAEDVQHSMPPAENIADRAKQISGTSQGQTSLNQIDSSVVPSQRVSFDSAGIKKSPTSLTDRGSSAAVAVGATTSAMQSKDKKSFENTKADKKDKKKSKDKKSKSESAVNESGTGEKQKKRHRVAEAFRKIFHRKKKSKGQNSAPSQLNVTGVGVAGAGASAATLAGIQKTVSESHSESDDESDFSSNASSLSLETTHVNNPALMASVLHGEEPALEGNYSFASLTTDTSTFYPRHIEVPASELHDGTVKGKSEVNNSDRKEGAPSSSRWDIELSNGTTEQPPAMVPVSVPLGGKRESRSSSRSIESNDHERGRSSKTSYSRSYSPGHSRKQAEQNEQRPHVVLYEATDQQHAAPPATDDEHPLVWREIIEQPGAIEAGSKKYIRSRSTSSSSSGYSADKLHNPNGSMSVKSQLIPTPVSQDYQCAMLPSSNQYQGTTCDEIAKQSSLPASGNRHRADSNRSSRSSSRSDRHARYTQPLVEFNKDLSGQLYSSAPRGQYHKLSTSSSSSSSSINSLAGRIILVGQSRNFTERMNSYRLRVGGGQSKDENKARGATSRSRSSSSTSSISSIDSDKLPPPLIKVKSTYNGDSRGKETKQTQPQTQKATEPQLFQPSTTKYEHLPSPKKQATKPPEGMLSFQKPAYDATFWDDLASDSSNDSTSPRLSTLAGTRPVHGEPASNPMEHNGY